MIWLVRDFDLLAVLLHAATLSLEAIILGGVFFHLCITSKAPESPAQSACRRLLSKAAIAMALTEIVSIAVSAAMLTQGSSLGWRDLLSASFLRAQLASVFLSIVLAIAARLRVHSRLLLLCGLALVASTVWLSHAVSRMDHRLLVAILTALHHLGTAAWLGAMPYLLLSLRASPDPQQQEKWIRRFSIMAMVSVAVLVSAGAGMSWFYVASLEGLYATSYGVLLLAKVYLLLLMLTLGGANWYLLRSASSIPGPLLLRIRRFSEVEIGIGFTVLLAAASLTSQSPAVDVTQDRVSRADYVQRMGPAWPRLSSPPLAALAPPSAMQQAIVDQQFNGLTPSDANDMAWSEYNHHWAGLAVLAAGLLALLSRSTRMRAARYWPLAFLGLAAFILLRADPEAWPLGPRPFWATFSSPDTLEHRLYALLIALFAAFECAVQAGRLRAQWAALIFPAMCALGGALLLTHGHESGNAKDELLANASHTLIALLGVTAGWARWLELRTGTRAKQGSPQELSLPLSRAHRIAGFVWPIALVLVAVVLLDYRES